MTPADIDRVFGRGRLRMVTGEHVEVFREASQPGERRRYTKRFLATAAGDFRDWTEREWRILARLVGHGIGPVPDVVQFDRGAADRPALVQTYDAGITVDHWATLLPVQRDGVLLRHVFEDCAHWWALARHCLVALDAIHELQLVHLDLKADNVCIPFEPTDYNPRAPGQLLRPRFEQIALIDFAFSLVSGETLTRALPIARQHDYVYQSPRLLQALEAGSRGDLLPTRQLDWRCDVFSLAAMLRRYLPDPEAPLEGTWTRPRHAQARALVRRLLEAHDAVQPAQRPHLDLLALTAHALHDDELAESLSRGWTLAIDSEAASDGWPTPVTRIAMPVSVDIRADPLATLRPDQTPQGAGRAGRVAAAALVASMAAIGAPLLYDSWSAARERELAEAAQATQVAQATQAAADFAPPRVPTSPSQPRTDAVASPEHADMAAATAGPTPTPTPTPSPAVAPALAKVSAHAAAPAVRPPATVARVTSAEAGTAAPATRVRARASANPVTRMSTRPVLPVSERERALAWLTMRGPAPRSAARPGPGVASAVAPAPVPTLAAAAPASATASARPAVAWATPTPAPASEPVPALMPTQAPVPAPATAPMPTDLALRAGEVIGRDLPRVVQRVEQRVLRVMDIAAQRDTARQDDQIRRAASAIRDNTDVPLPVAELAADDARQLHEAARAAYWRRGSAREAHSHELKAFGANPRDADVVSSLAFLSLKQQPPQVDMARQMALYSLSLHDARNAGGRIEDWTTLAIASALLGRDRDARSAWYISLVLAPQAERQCRAAVNAYALYGDRLRASVEAMLYRAHTSGRAEGSAFCEWPPHWTAQRPTR